MHAYTKKNGADFWLSTGFDEKSCFFVRIKTMDRKVLSFRNQDHGKKMLVNEGKLLFDLVIKIRFNWFGFLSG